MNQDQIIEDLLTRGVENIISDKKTLETALKSGKKLNCYLGIDPTASRIHLGHAFPLRKMRQMVELGHNVTFLIGSYTALVGDTSDKDGERPMLTLEQIEENFIEYKQLASKFLDFDKVTVVHNGDWLSKLSFKELLEIASNFSVNDFTSRELIRKRLDAGKRVSLPETLYPLMQGYDSYHLDTDIQFGGTDQTFNMQAGRTLNKRLRGKDSFIIANGFLPGTDGRKMSKSWDNAIWLDDSAEEVFGKVMRVSDDALQDYFVYGTNMPLDEIKTHTDELKDTNPMELKKVLARRVVAELCGDAGIAAAEAHFVATIQNKSAGDDALEITIDSTEIDMAGLRELFVKHGLAQSKSEAMRLFKQGAIHAGDQALDANGVLDISNPVTLRIGKRRYLKINH